MTQMTLPLSEGGSPSGSFKVEEVGESDAGPRAPTDKPLSAHSLDTEDQSTPGSMRILHRQTSAPNVCKILEDPAADCLPSVPRRRRSYTSEFSDIQGRTLDVVIPAAEEDETIQDSNHHHDDDDDLSSRPPMDRTVSRRLSDSERRFEATEDTIAPPVRVGSIASIVSHGSNHSSETATNEAMESMILSQIPEHIRNQMTPEMWKKIFTVNAISKRSEVASVCSDITDDLRSAKSLSTKSFLSPPAKRSSIDFTGEVSPIYYDELGMVRENLESHSTFRTEDSNDLLSQATPSSYQSIPSSTTKDEDTAASPSSPAMMSPPTRKPSSSRSSANEPPKTAIRPRRGSADHRAARDKIRVKKSKGDAPPRPPQKNRSIGRETDASVSDDQPSSGRRVPKKRKFSVRFNPQADVRNFERVLEVHPSTSSGPSVGIGWAFDESTEKLTFGRPPNRRSSDMLLSRQTRERMVRVELGYSAKEIARAVRETLKIKNQRRRTVNNLQEYGSFAPVEKVEYLMEKCQRKLGRLRLGRKA